MVYNLKKGKRIHSSCAKQLHTNTFSSQLLKQFLLDEITQVDIYSPSSFSANPKSQSIELALDTLLDPLRHRSVDLRARNENLTLK